MGGYTLYPKIPTNGDVKWNSLSWIIRVSLFPFSSVFLSGLSLVVLAQSYTSDASNPYLIFIDFRLINLNLFQVFKSLFFDSKIFFKSITKIEIDACYRLFSLLVYLGK